MNIFYDKILSSMSDKDKDKIKRRINIDKANLTENEINLLSYILNRTKEENILINNITEEGYGTNIFGTYTPSYENQRIKLSEDRLGIGFRENASTLGHEIGHSFQFNKTIAHPSSGNQWPSNPIMEESKMMLKQPGITNENFADFFSRALLGRLKINPNNKIKKVQGKSGATYLTGMDKFRTESDSLNFDYMLKKLFKEIPPNNEGVYERFKKRFNL